MFDDAGGLPFSVLAGNHDVRGDDQRGATPYLRTFGPQGFSGMETYGGSSPDGYNSYHVVRGGGREWLILTLDWRASDAAFAPLVLPAPRPPSAVMPQGTVAYWRFDEAGLTTAGADSAPVAPGTVARDLTGNGNDLTSELLYGSGRQALTWSSEHHDAQPAHASLRFDGRKQPDRGAVLRTGPDSPINSATFESGYTIETFVKLPDPYLGDHAWMGILSWEGRSGDAGENSGDPDEPTCSLNLSGERFLQFVVYPVPVDADPISWSHAFPVGRWMHVAIVNDGRHTTVYVEGSKIVRNAAEESRGISTLGKPFAVGGTQYAEQYEQGFYGWIGDIRIVSRALRPDQFLTAASS